MRSRKWKRERETKGKRGIKEETKREREEDIKGS